MNYRHKLQYLLVQKLKISNQEVKNALAGGLIKVDDEVVTDNCLVGPYQKVMYGKTMVQDASEFVYMAYYKPMGIECTLNLAIANNLAQALPKEAAHLFYAGRLDKASEGLLLLTNDGFLYNKIIQPERKLPKVYLVKLEKPYAADFKDKMEAGVEILGTKTLPCKIELIDLDSFKIELTQGLNRQIRRMCFALENYVTELKRISIGPIELLKLKPGNYRLLTEHEILQLQKL